MLYNVQSLKSDYQKEVCAHPFEICHFNMYVCVIKKKKQKKKYTDLLAGLTPVRLLSAVRPFVPLHVVFLDEAHVALVAAEWLLSCADKAKHF